MFITTYSMNVWNVEVWSITLKYEKDNVLR